MFKRLIMALAVVGITAMPFTAAAATAPAVQVESQVTVANTNTNNQYATTATAAVDQVVAIQVWTHNREEAGSGKVAQNVKVQINLPTTPNTVQPIKATVSGDNTNTSTSTATVNLPLARAFLQVIPGTAVWRHNVGDNTNVNYVNTNLSAAQQTALFAGGAVIGNQNPCFNFESTVTVLARVEAPVMSLTKQVEVDGSGAKFSTENTANAGNTLRYLFTVKNESNTVLHNVVVGDNLAPYMTLVPGTTILVDSNTGAAGKVWTDGLVTGGITIDDLAPGATELVYFKVKLADVIPCGDRGLTNVGVAKADNIPAIENTALTHVNVTCATTPPTTPPVTPPTTPTTPVTPTTPSTTLPQTGAESALAGMTGTGVLGYTVQAYRKSKRSLADALKQIKR